MTPRAPAFSKTAIVLHWLVALGIVGMLGFGLFVGAMESGPDKTAMIQVHKSFGVLVGTLALLRLVWRVREGFPGPVPGLPAWEARAAHRMHLALLVMTIAIPLTGMLKSVSYARPVHVFGVLVVPKLLEEKSVVFNEIVSWLHATLAYALLVALALHIGAALKHHLVDRDATLRRMVRPFSPPTA